jgi:hypothetical protein
LRSEHVLRLHHADQGVVELHVADCGRAAAAQLRAARSSNA